MPRGGSAHTGKSITTFIIAYATVWHAAAVGASDAQGAGSASEPADLRRRQFGQDWPAFLGPTGDSKSTERGIRTQWAGGGLPTVWQLDLGQGYGICAVSRGRLFIYDYADGKGRLRCLRSEDGRPLWEFEHAYQYRDYFGYDQGPRCSPVVDGNRVYLFGVTGVLLCLDVESGRRVWEVDTQREFGVVQNFFGVGSNPVVHDQLLVAMVGGSPPEYRNVGPAGLSRVVGNGSGVVAFDKHTGEVVYRLSDQLASYASLKLARHQGRPWCFAFARGGLLGFQPQTGELDFFFPWRAPLLESVNASVPVVVRDEVLISETYGPGSALLRFRPHECDVIWSDAGKGRNKSMQAHWNTPIHHQGYLYGCSGRHASNAELRCIRWQTGEVLWRQPGLTRSSLLYVDGHFVCLSEDGTMRLLRATPEKYDPVATWRLETPRGGSLLGEPAWAAPILAHGLLYVRGSRRLVCLELIAPPAE